MSLNTRGMSPPPVYDVRSDQRSSTNLKPYLQLPHLISLTWLAYPILSLLFVIFRLQVSLSSSQDAVANAKGDLLTSCKAAEQAATAAASMPRYMAIATNEQFADAVNGSMNAARAALVLSLTVMEAVINFIVDIYRSTFLCFVELVVRGGLSILISAVQELNTFVQGAASSIKSGIQSDIATANSAIQTAISAINKVNPFGNISVPQFSIPSLSGLDNITLPTDFENTLISLNSSLPDFSEIKSKIDAILDTPFELVKQDINETFANMSFDASVLPVPAQNFLTFCNEMDTSVVDDLGQDLIKIARIGTIILILLVVLLIAGNCALEWYKWRCQQRHLEYTRQAWVSDPTLYHAGSSSAPEIRLTDHNLLMLQANGLHPLLTRIANNISTGLRMSPSQHTHLHWFFHYVFHPPALACFLIGFFGLLSVQIQLIAVKPLAAKFSDRAAAATTDFSTSIATSINNSMFNQSSVYANDINGRVDVIQSTINNGLFGWVNGTTTTLNDTINEFYSDVQSIVSTVFNGTILEQPAQDFIKCILGSKVDAIEEALTFLNENLQINMPRVNATILMLSPAEVNEATQPIAAAAIGGGQGDKEGLIGRLLNTYEESLHKERVMFAIFMGLWGVVVFMALCIIFWHSYARHWVEAHRRRKWQREQRSGIDGIVIPFRVNDYGNGGMAGNRSHLDLPALTPLPSPKLEDPQAKDETSWDSFFGQKAGVTPASREISKPMKLMAIGKKAFSTKGSAGDVEKSAEHSDGEESESTGWFSWFSGKFTKKAQVEATDQTSRQRFRPNLTISVDRASSIKPAEPARNGNQAGPPSAWSASPTGSSGSMAWMKKNIIPSKKPQNPPGLPVRNPPRRNANVPTDVDSGYDDSDLKPLNPKPGSLAPPLHHGFAPTWRLNTPPPVQTPPYQSQNSLAPPTDRHQRSSWVPYSAWGGADNRNSSTPVTRLLTTTHARQSSSLNPFMTPFDDEHRVGTNARGSVSNNPFSPIAL